MDRFVALRVFVQVVDSGGFARAADTLQLSTTATSRHVAGLEAHLDTRLLHRTTRKISLTDAGRAFYERAVQVLADLEEAEEEAARSTATPRGLLRLTAPVNLGVRHVAPVVAAFLERHPQLRFDVSLSDRVVNLVEEGIDLAIRVGHPGSENTVVRRLAETRIVPCASPAYLAARGAPRVPADLAEHNCFTYEYVVPRDLWHFRGPNGEVHTVRVRGNLHSNNGDLLAEAAARGAGITFEPAFIVGEDMRAGRLVPLLQDYEPAPVPIYAVYPSRRHIAAKVRLFVEFITERFAGGRDWIRS